ncbi:MAG TPA: phosphate ABC transporter permease subunit PstC [Thermodesulfatator atlanticus]|uniref:Phosphate transport system permease protein n=1 Tax=Thermodesulfatator atlanticus TaxID=501497 RepID=A0A7V5P1V7_9BACT|nr:phosphate ABC transporter permease subunit PstC [Thermodesulfatator atlanticus]
MFEPKNLYRQIKYDLLFRKLATGMGALVIFLVVATFFTLVYESWPAIKAFGLRFLWNTTWDPVSLEFGALPFLVGTLITSFLALLIATPFALAGAIFLGELAPPKIANPVSFVMELLAGIPSVIYGLWALFYLVPLVRAFELKIGAPPYGLGLFTASLVLAIMILPYALSVARDVIKLVPPDLKEAAYGLGATRWETIRHIILPYARSGILAGIVLALGRALGETMAVTMVIGNRSAMPQSIWDLANTMASVIANEFTEATEDIHLAALVEIGLLLFVITVVVNLVARIFIVKTKVR